MQIFSSGFSSIGVSELYYHFVSENICLLCFLDLLLVCILMSNLSLSLSLSHMYVFKPEQVYMWKISGFGQLEWKLILCSEQNPNYGQLSIDDVATLPNLKLSCNSSGTE